MKKKLNSHINNIYIFFFKKIIVKKKKKKYIYIYKFIILYLLYL